MLIRKPKFKLALFGVMFLAAFGFLLNSGISLADDDDDEEDRYEQRHKEDDDDRYERRRAPQPVPQPAPEPVQQPDPQVQQPAPATDQAIEIVKKIVSKPDYSKFYDTDADGIADALDAHPGEDDFAYHIEDADRDGLADDLEFLKLSR